MRIFVFIILPLLCVAGFIFYLFTRWVESGKGTGKSVPMDNLKAIGTGADAVRALDQILTDNTLIGDPRWRENARATVTEWYGRGPKKLGS